VIADKAKANAVSNNVPVAKGSSADAKITAAQPRRSKK
jgi:hypothetical protein